MSSARCLGEEEVLRVQAWRLSELLKWRQYLPILVEAVKSVLGDAEVYLTGSALEGRLTVDSDIDVIVVVKRAPRSGLERARVLDEIWRIMESRGVPWWYPFEILLLSEDEFRILEKGGIARIA